MTNDIFVVLCPDGCLTYDDMKMCQEEKWVPIAVIKKEGKVTVPCFHDPELARKFGKRNYPKDWLAGVIALSLAEIKWMLEVKGWVLQVYTYPNLCKDLEGFGYEILEFQSQPDLFMKRK
jgi:hypothetical protein